MHEFPFWAIILKYTTPSHNLEKVLIEKLCIYENKSEMTIKRKIHLWKTNRCHPLNRLELIKISFALGFTSHTTSSFLQEFGEYGLNPWNKQELVYIYCLDRKIAYESLSYQFKQNNYPSKKSTSLDLIAMSHSLNELLENIEKYSDYFGLYPLKTYERFKKRLDTLREPVDDNPRYSYKRIMEEYLRVGIPYMRNIKSFSLEMKNIKKNWPNEKTLREMYNRQIPVSRKAFILIYLATSVPNSQKLNNALKNNNLGFLNQNDRFEQILLQTLDTYDQENEYYLDVLKRHLSRYFQR